MTIPAILLAAIWGGSLVAILIWAWRAPLIDEEDEL